MNQQKKLEKNVLYQTLYQVLATLTPIITSPYISRVLGAEQLGIFSYTNSNASYFSLFAIMGMANLGCREIAKSNRDRRKLSETFSALYGLQLLTGFTSGLFYIFYLIFGCKDNHTIALLQIFWVISSWLDVSWFFFGIEEFEITVKRNIVIKILTVMSILFFVKKGSSGLLIYTLIMSGGNFLSIIALYPFLHKFIDFLPPHISKMKPFFMADIILFVPILASSVYHIMDKTMLGNLSGYVELGLYYNADKLINIPIGILNGFGTVLMPRVSMLYTRNQANEKKKVQELSFELYTMVSIALAAGIAAIAPEFVPVFFGRDYAGCVVLVILFAPTLIIKSYGIYIRMVYLIPAGKETGYIYGVIGGAITNLIANFCLIPRLNAQGAVIGTMLAEGVSLLIQYLYVKGEFNLVRCVKIICKYILIGTAMCIIVRLVANVQRNDFIKLALEVLAGGGTYLVLSAGMYAKEQNIRKRY